MQDFKSSKMLHLFISILVIMAFVITSGSLKAQTTGQITGKVIEAETKSPLPGANILIEGTKRGAATDYDGRFRIMKVPAGTYTVKTSFLGYQDLAKEVQVSAGQTVTVEFALKESILEGEQVVVYGELTRGQAKALQKQKTAQNIVQVVSEEFFGRFPDRNAAETVRRLPAVSIARDQGEGEMVQIRGMNEEYNALTLNGVRIPAPDANGRRSVGLDLVNNRLLGEIEVIKAITPDMDGDAIGGVVNFGLRRAPDAGTAVLGISGGYNNQMSDFETYGRDIQEYYAVYGKRFFDSKLGVIIDGAYYKTNRDSKLRELNYTDDDGVYDEVIFAQHTNDYDVKRQRYGLSLSTDYEFNPSHRLYLTLNHNSYLDDEIRREVEYVIEDEEETRETRNRLEDQRLNLGMFGGEHTLGWMQIDYKAAVIKSSEDTPGRTYLRYQRDNSFTGYSNDDIKEFDGTTKFSGLDPLKLNRIRYDLILKEDQDISGQLNLKIPFAFMKGDLSHFKFGTKVLRKDVSLERERYQTTKFTDTYTIPEGNFGFVDVRYDNKELNSVVESGSWKARDNYTDSYDASETITSVYGMTQLNLTPKFSTVMGLRLENTKNDYIQPYPEDADIIGKSELTGSGGYSNILPSIHFMYKFNNNNNLKLAYSTGLARPRYVNLIPSMVINEPPASNSALGEIKYGNPDLEPRTAYNFDIMFDRFTSNLGLLSFGVFFKNFKAWHTTKTWIEKHDFVNDDGDYAPDGVEETYEASMPVMGDGTANFYGFEMNAQQRLAAFSPALKYFAVNANYTYTKSKGEIDGRTVVMTRSPKHIANMSLIYDNVDLGLSVVVAANYRDALLTGVGDNKYRDVYFDHEFFVDFSIVQKITDKILLIGQLNGLGITNEHEVLGNPRKDYSRTQQTEWYGLYGTLGLQYTLW